MFQTLYKVTKKCGDSTIFTALFYEKKDAEMFAEKVVDETDECLTFSKHYYRDGSFLYSWTGDHNEVTLDDDAYITDYRANKFIMQPFGLEFAQRWDIDEFIKANHQKCGVTD
jgi:hypothetical protein